MSEATTSNPTPDEAVFPAPAGSPLDSSRTAFLPCACGAALSPTAEAELVCWWCGENLKPCENGSGSESQKHGTTSSHEMQHDRRMPERVLWEYVAVHPEGLEKHLGRKLQQEDRDTLLRWLESGCPPPEGSLGQTCRESPLSILQSLGSVQDSSAFAGDVEVRENAEVSGPPPLTPESKQSANGGFAAPIC